MDYFFLNSIAFLFNSIYDSDVILTNGSSDRNITLNKANHD